MIYRENRPWGWFEILFEEPGMKLKRIMVHPQRRLSLQSHQHRAENWTILEGKAIVTVDKGRVHAFANQAIHIPRGAIHRIENRGETDLIFIEVQTGDYLGEDDIIRYEDDFARV